MSTSITTRLLNKNPTDVSMALLVVAAQANP